MSIWRRTSLPSVRSVLRRILWRVRMCSSSSSNSSKARKNTTHQRILHPLSLLPLQQIQRLPCTSPYNLGAEHHQRWAIDLRRRVARLNKAAAVAASMTRCPSFACSVQSLGPTGRRAAEPRSLQGCLLWLYLLFRLRLCRDRDLRVIGMGRAKAVERTGGVDHAMLKAQVLVSSNRATDCSPSTHRVTSTQGPALSCRRRKWRPCTLT